MPEETNLMRLPYGLARKFARTHRCAGCWGNLALYPQDGSQMFSIECVDCRGAMRGYVSEHYVQSRQQSSAFELRTAKRTLRGAVPWLLESEPSEQLIKELYGESE